MNSDVLDLSLGDVCSDAFLFAFRLQELHGEETDAIQVQNEVDELFQEIETSAHQAGIPLEDVHQAKYALAAFLDERVLNSELPFRAGWASRPLQLKYFDDSAAGEEFYNRLDNLRHTPETRLNRSLDIFFLCMVLGFKGMYVDAAGHEKRNILIHKVAQDIETEEGKRGGALLGGGEGGGDRPRASHALPLWLYPAAAGAFILILFLVFSLWLDRSVSSFLDVFPS